MQTCDSQRYTKSPFKKEFNKAAGAMKAEGNNESSWYVMDNYRLKKTESNAGVATGNWQKKKKTFWSWKRRDRILFSKAEKHQRGLLTDTRKLVS